MLSSSAPRRRTTSWLQGGAWLPAVILLAQPAAALAQDAVCKAQQDGLASVAQKYKADYDEFSKEGDDIKKDAVTIGGHIDWADVEIIFDLPTTTIKDQRIVLSLPQTTVKQQDIIFDTPSVRMVEVKVGQHPETTCHDTWIEVGFVKTKGVPACTVTWHDNIISVPQTFMERQRIVMGVPEFRWDTTDVVMGIPEFRMERQRWVIGLPQITVTSIAINSDKVKDRSEGLQNRIRETQERQKADMIDGVHALFACHRGAVAEQRKTVTAQFENGLAQLDGAIQSLRSQGADPSKVTNSGGETIDLVARRADLVKARDKALADFDAALRGLDANEQKSVDQIKA